jgi:hypothetical protein
MQAALLYELTGDPDGDTLESKLDGEFPALDVERTAYLDGKTLHHGTAAARIETERRVPVPGTTEILTEADPVTRRVQTDFFLDLSEGWLGVDSSDGEFLSDLLLSRFGVVAEPQEIRVQAWSERLERQDDAGVWGISYSQENAERADRAGAQYHGDAAVHKLPPEGLSAVGFYYNWDGQPVRGMLAESGYAAVYRDWSPDRFGRWLADEILPYCVYDAEAQQELGGEV